MAQWAALSESVFDFRGVPFPMIFQDSTPMFWPMSIAFSDFTLRSRVQSLRAHLKPGFEKPNSLFTPPQILRWPLPCFGVRKRLDSFQVFALNLRIKIEVTLIFDNATNKAKIIDIFVLVLYNLYIKAVGQSAIIMSSIILAQERMVIPMT